MSDLSSIIARLEKAEGPSYSLEVEIAYLTGFWPAERIDRVTRADDGHLAVWFTEGPDLPLPPAVLSSIDAAVSLANRVLPGWFWRCGSTPLFPNGWAHVSRYHADHCDRQDEASCADGKAANVAIALVLATLRALQQKGSSNG